MERNETCLIVNGSNYIEVVIYNLTIHQNLESYSYFTANETQLVVTTTPDRALMDFLKKCSYIDIYFLDKKCIERELCINSFNVEDRVLCIDLLTRDRTLSNIEEDPLYISYMRDKKITNILDGNG